MPMPPAKISVPIPTEPPSTKPIASTVSSMLVRATEMRTPRWATASIRLSRGPAPKAAPM